MCPLWACAHNLLVEGLPIFTQEHTLVSVSLLCLAQVVNKSQNWGSTSCLVLVLQILHQITAFVLSSHNPACCSCQCLDLGKMKPVSRVVLLLPFHWMYIPFLSCHRISYKLEVSSQSCLVGKGETIMGFDVVLYSPGV